MILDLLIVVVLLAAAIFAFQRGTIQPVLAEVTFFGLLYLFGAHSAGFAGLTRPVSRGSGLIDAAFALAIAMACTVGAAWVGGRIHRMPVVRGPDGFFGIFINVGLALIALDVLIGALAAMDQADRPVTQSSKLTATQADRVANVIDSNFVSSALVGQRDVAALRAAGPGGLDPRLTPQLVRVERFYDDWLHTDLLASRLAPRIVSLCSHLGGIKPSALPTK